MKVLVIHFWDSRNNIGFWPEGELIIRHNFGVLAQDPSPFWSVEHHVFLNVVGDATQMHALASELVTEEHIITWPKRLSNKGRDHLVVFNRVARRAYDDLRSKILSADLVFVIGQDTILINHLGLNIIEVLYGLMAGPNAHVYNDALGWYSQLGRDRCDYVSHTAPPGAGPNRFRHNGAAAAIGLWKTSRFDKILQSVCQLDMAAERYLGRVLRQPCLYLKPVPDFYVGSFGYGKEGWASHYLECAADPLRTGEIRGWNL